MAACCCMMVFSRQMATLVSLRDCTANLCFSPSQGLRSMHIVHCSSLRWAFMHGLL